jgi:hypothetical protein
MKGWDECECGLRERGKDVLWLRQDGGASAIALSRRPSASSERPLGGGTPVQNTKRGQVGGMTLRPKRRRRARPPRRRAANKAVDSPDPPSPTSHPHLVAFPSLHTYSLRQGLLAPALILTTSALGPSFSSSSAWRPCPRTLWLAPTITADPPPWSPRLRTTL